MRILTIFIATSLILSGCHSALTIREYPVHISSSLKEHKTDIVDPFATKEEHKTKNEIESHPVTLEEAVARAAAVEVTEESGEFILYDGESIYAKVSEAEHKRLALSLSSDGKKLSKEKQTKVMNLLKQKRPNQAGDDNSE